MAVKRVVGLCTDQRAAGIGTHIYTYIYICICICAVTTLSCVHVGCEEWGDACPHFVGVWVLKTQRECAWWSAAYEWNLLVDEKRGSNGGSKVSG